MEYEIIISETFIEETQEIYDYIKYNLKAEQASSNLRREIQEKIEVLKHSPRIYAKLYKLDRYGRIFRRIVVSHYVILYTIIEERKQVLISHIYYGKRNYIDGGLL